MSDRLPSLPVARMAAWQCNAFIKYCYIYEVSLDTQQFLTA
jgi:hypothetical protein